MDWKRSAIEDLRNYRHHKDSLENIPSRIVALRDQYVAIKGGMSDGTPVQGRGSTIEDRMLSNITERERLSHNYRAAQRLVELIERGLNGLDDRERKVLEGMYMGAGRGNVDKLCDELGYEQRQIYRIRDAALHKFTVSMYGITDY